MPDSHWDVFLSYSSPDRVEVEKLALRLEEANLRVFLDKWRLVPGQNFIPELDEAIRSSKSCAVFLGKDNVRPWQHQEVQAALSQAVRRVGPSGQPSFPVIPVLLLCLRLQRGSSVRGWGLTSWGRGPAAGERGRRAFMLPTLILLLIVFSLRLDLFPLIGGGDRDGAIHMIRTGEVFSNPADFLAAVGDVLHHLALPALALGFTLAATVSRLSRSAMLEVTSTSPLSENG
jgi:hypothetical protein